MAHSRKLRILALHSFRTSAKIFQEQARNRRRRTRRQQPADTTCRRRHLPLPPPAPPPRAAVPIFLPASHLIFTTPFLLED